MEKIDGEELVREARKVIDAYFRGEDYTPKIQGRAGVFVTLKKNGELRGCIGIPFPTDLATALKEAAIGALNDPRFPPVEKEELKEITVEISVLTPPERVSDPLKEIKVGRDGIMIVYGPFSGLLLPQVPVEEGWSLEEFLDYGCLKAGLPPGCWRSKDVAIFKFTARIFAETEPYGRIEEIKLEEQ